MGVKVVTPRFEGPLELLMHLILRHEIDICEIALATIVKDYLDEVDRMEALELESATEFLLGAATLVHLKSRRLLPEAAGPEDEDEEELPDSRDRLLARLLECETFRRAGTALEELAAVAALSHPRTAGPEPHYLNLLPDLLEGVRPTDIGAACARALRRLEAPRVDVAHMAGDTLHVSDVVADLTLRLPEEGRTTFGDLTRSLGGRREVVVHFLALLELFKQDRVDLHQNGSLGRIVVEWRRPAPVLAPEFAVPEPVG